MWDENIIDIPAHVPEKHQAHDYEQGEYNVGGFGLFHLGWLWC